MLNERIVQELIDGLSEIFSQHVLQIILYGSVARREATEESDIDIAVILDGVPDSATRERFIEWNSEMDMKYGRVFSIVDIENAKLDKWGDVLPFYRNIRKEGVVLWKAA